ncbi:MAG: hypothetical protein AAGJ38_05210 [Planctomycetota bacterium]
MTDATTPIPARFRWLKRCAMAGLIGLVLLLGLRAVWGYVWHARFQAALQEIRDRGEPIDLADFNPPPVDDADNGAVWLRQAMAAWPNVPGSSQSIIDTDWYLDPDLHADPITDNAAYLAALGPALELIDRAAAAPTSHWETEPFVSPMLTNYQTDYLGELGRLSQLMSDAAARAADDGEIEDAVGLAIRLHRLSFALYDAPVSLNDYLTRISIQSRAVGWIEDQIVSLNNLAAKPPMLLLMEILVEESSSREMLRDAIIFQRMYTQNTIQGLADGQIGYQEIAFSFTPSLWDGPRRWLFRPLFYRDGCILLDHYTRAIDATGPSGSRDFSAFDAALSHLHDQPLTHPVATELPYSISWSERMRNQHVTRQRLARTALALKLYELEHGRVAPTLAALVPDYLDAVPVDPMDPAGGPLRYLPEGGEVTLPGYHWLTDEQVAEVESRRLPLIYSVGFNRVDDGGMMWLNHDGTPDQSSRSYHRDDGDVTDQWFLLAPVPEPIPDPDPYGFGGYGGFGPGSLYGEP